MKIDKGLISTTIGVICIIISSVLFGLIRAGYLNESGFILFGICLIIGGTTLLLGILWL